ncbi:MAG: N-acetyl-gamma-glutamyl-phosphate reductase [Eubacteriales bacterium]|nr:N-acetyl-gamma-glutamyl-phosphate reductase [Eubacteriales bacterium]
MEKTKVFIDGKAGTTGLRIYDRLSIREDIELIALSEELRKDPQARKQALNSCDVAFLCLPDDAAREAVAMVDNPRVKVIDTSTAHRTSPEFAYGFPELSPDFEDKIKTYNRIAVPGCHAGGFIALVYPLIEKGIISADIKLTCHSITGYSGGGKKMISEYESDDVNPLFKAPRQYGLLQNHKHLNEMVKISGINSLPIFCPIVADFYSGMEVTVPLFKENLEYGGIEDIKKIYLDKYTGDIVKYVQSDDEGGFLSAGKRATLDSMEVEVFGNEDRILLVARYDNLGKGASGAAIECMNIALGKDKKLGLTL